MRRIKPWILVAVLTIAMFTLAPPGTDAGATADSTQVQTAAAPQPHMRAAYSALQTAGRELKKSRHDKGGHRVRALELVNQAMREVRKGIAAGSK